MGAAIDAFGLTGGALKRNPVLVGAALVVAVASAISGVASNAIPVVGALVGLVFFFVEPFLAAGYLGMANAAVDGDTGFGTFVDAGSEHYLRLLGARLLTAAATFVYVLVLAIVLVFVVGLGAGSLGGTGAGGPEPGALLGALGAVAAVVVVLSLVVFLVAGFLIQFHPAAIVMAEAGIVESFRYSYTLATDNFLSALGYSVLVAVVGALISGASLLVGGGGVLASASAVGGVADSPTGAMATGLAALGVVNLLGTLFSVAVLRTYYVSFVRSVTGTA